MKKKAVILLYRQVSPVYRTQARSFIRTVKELDYELIIVGFEDKKLGYPIVKVDLDNFLLLDADVLKICKKYNVIRIFGLSDLDVYSASLLSEKNNIEGLLPDVCINFRNKNIMNVRAKELGISIPDFCIPYTLNTVKNFAEHHGLPIVIKPYDGYGSKNVFIIKQAQDIEKVWDTIKNVRQNYRVESFIDGEHFYVDSLIKDNVVVFEMISKYNYSVSEYENEIGSGVTIKYNRKKYHDEMLDLNKKILIGFGLKTGIAHAEFYHNKQGIFFGETHCRCGGGPIFSIIKVGYSIDMIEELLKIHLLPKHVPNILDNNLEIGTEYFVSKTFGRITHISDLNNILKLNTVADAEIWLSKGDTIKKPEVCSDVLGYYISTGKSFDEVCCNFKNIRDNFIVKTESI